jgi:aconitate hydratase
MASELEMRASVRRAMRIDGESFDYFSLCAFEKSNPGVRIARLPYCIRILLENLLRHCDGEAVTVQAVLGVARAPDAAAPDEVPYHPSRVVMPDSSGGPLLVDLAAMRDAVAARGLDPSLVNPVIPVQMVVDHSALTEFAGTPDALSKNLEAEFRLNAERFALVRWAQQAFERFRVVPPGNGILHQINLEFLAEVVACRSGVLFPDSLVGMDSHTPMVNGLGLFGWGVGGVEAGSALLGEPITMRLPRVVGCRLVGKLRAGVTATDAVLTVTQRMRRHGVVGKFVEFHGEGLDNLSVPDRATIANMTPEYGATLGYFPIDAQTVAYLRATGRSEAQCRRVEQYAREQRLWREEVPEFDEELEIDMAQVEPCLSGPQRPEERVPLGEVPQSFSAAFPKAQGSHEVDGLGNGDVVIAAITSCTNTSNPSVMIAAGLLARNAVARGLRAKPWVKTSLAPGSLRVAEYLSKAGLIAPLEALGFHVVGFGCMTCMGSSGPLDPTIERQIREGDLTVATVLSGNRNFEARVHLLARANYLASPPLVVAYAIAGSVLADVSTRALGVDKEGKPVCLADIWPSDEEVSQVARQVIEPALFTAGYLHVDRGSDAWEQLAKGKGSTFSWVEDSTYIKPPPYVDAKGPSGSLSAARTLVMLGDNVTTDHITPVGTTYADSEVGKYLRALGVVPADFNTLSSRRANPEVVARTTYANVRLKNELVPGKEGEFTRHFPSGQVMAVYEAAEQYRLEGVPLVVIAGSNYGAGSSRDTAAKGVRLLGVRAVIAESFERIHRSNLVCMGVLPLEFMLGESRKTLGLTGTETFSIAEELVAIAPRAEVQLRIEREDGSIALTTLRVRIDTQRECNWFRRGGVMPYFIDKLSKGVYE